LVKLAVPTVNVRLETKLSIAVVQTDLQVYQLQYKDVFVFPNLVLEKIAQKDINV
jgi:hypothetical protein